MKTQTLFSSCSFQGRAQAAVIAVAFALLCCPNLLFGQTEFKLTGSNSSSGDDFGTDVTVSGDIAAVGAPLYDDPILGGNTGTVYIYEFNGTSWNEIQQLTASDASAGDYFGYSVNLEGGFLIVGSRLDDDKGSSSGSAYVFEHNGTVWAQTQKLTASDGQGGDQFGISLDHDGNNLIVGAWQEDQAGSGAGAAYVFGYNGAVWIESQKLVASDGGSNDIFGYSVAISGTNAVIGAHWEDQQGGNAGAAYVFSLDTIGWTQKQKLLASDGISNDNFGYAVSIFGNRIVAGAIGDDDNGGSSGSTYVFDFNGTNWAQSQKVTPSDGQSSDQFGYSVTLGDSILVVGARLDDDDGSQSGSAYLYEQSGATLTSVLKLKPSDGTSNRGFGSSLDFDDKRLIVGLDPSYSGNAAYILDFENQNDVCADAILVACGASITGNTTFATNTGAPSFCGTNLSTAPGVWYKVEGTGQAVTTGLCSSDFDTKIGVFTGSCGALTCVTGIDDNCGEQSTVTFATTLGEEYLVYVTGFQTEAGSYTLDIVCVPPLNDLCAGAIAVVCGDTATGSTINATNTGAPASLCNGDHTQARGVWYSFLGTGNPVIASLCGSEYDTRLGVFAGPCGTLSCIVGNDDACGLQSEVAFNSILGLTYYIYVSGFNAQSASRGSYQLTIGCLNNNACAQALPLTCGTTINGSTSGATSTGNPGTCVVDLSTAPGVWYRVIGDGSVMTASTCGAGTTYDTKLGVFSGSCGGLVCVTGNDDTCGTQQLLSIVSWPSAVGVEYFVYVTGFGTHSGDFALELECQLNNDLCANAPSIACGDTVTGNTSIATSSDAPANCQVSLNTAAGVWYKLVGNGMNTMLSLCGSNYDTKIGVFSGTCGSLTCVAGNDDACDLQSKVTFATSNGATYYVYVTGFGNSKGDFELAVSCFTPACTTTPGNFTTAITESTARLNWSEVPDAIGYKIQGGEPGGGTVTLIVPSHPTSFKATGLDEGTTYIWTVRGICSPDLTLQSPMSPIDTFTTANPCIPPDPISTVNIAATTARLSWTIVPASSGYRVSGRPLGAASDIHLNVLGGGKTFLDVSSLAASTTYHWTVRAFCGGFSDPAVRDTFTTAASKGELAVATEDWQVELYPNPASDRVHIRLIGAEGPNAGEVVIYTSDGKQVQRTAWAAGNSTQTIELDGALSSGIYQVHVRRDDHIVVKRLVVLTE